MQYPINSGFLISLVVILSTASLTSTTSIRRDFGNSSTKLNASSSEVTDINSSNVTPASNLTLIMYSNSTEDNSTMYSVGFVIGSEIQSDLLNTSQSSPDEWPTSPNPILSSNQNFSKLQNSSLPTPLILPSLNYSNDQGGEVPTSPRPFMNQSMNAAGNSTDTLIIMSGSEFNSSSTDVSPSPPPISTDNFGVSPISKIGNFSEDNINISFNNLTEIKNGNFSEDNINISFNNLTEMNNGNYSEDNINISFNNLTEIQSGNFSESDSM